MLKWIYFSFHRPLLVLLDRNMDMATPLHHTWTYQALLHDVLDLNLNRVVVSEPENDNRPIDNHRNGPAYKPKTKSCDLNPTDKFWVTHRGSPFPTVAESIQEDLEEYKASEGEVKRLKESMVLLFDFSLLSMCLPYFRFLIFLFTLRRTKAMRLLWVWYLVQQLS